MRTQQRPSNDLEFKELQKESKRLKRKISKLECSEKVLLKELEQLSKKTKDLEIEIDDLTCQLEELDLDKEEKFDDTPRPQPQRQYPYEIRKTIYRALQSKTPIAEIPTLNNSVSRTY